MMKDTKIPLFKTPGFGLLDVDLDKYLEKNNPVKVTIEAEIVNAFGNDDGVSIEFALDIKSVRIAE